MDLIEFMKIKPVSIPDVESITLSLRHVSKCKGNFLANQSWYGHGVARKSRTVKKRMLQSPMATHPVADSTTQAVLPDSEYGT